MSVHDRFFARTIIYSEQAHQLVLKRHRVVSGICSYSIWSGDGAALSHQRRRRDAKKGNKKKNLSHFTPLSSKHDTYSAYLSRVWALLNPIANQTALRIEA